MECSCINEEQRKLLLEAISDEIIFTKGEIELFTKFEKFKDIRDQAIPMKEKKIQSFHELEKEIKGLTSCKELMTLSKEGAKWWFSSVHGKLGPYSSEKEAEEKAKSFGIKYERE